MSRSIHRRPSRIRLRLESLEDRSLPAVGPVAWWTGDNTGQDASSNGHNLTAFNGAGYAAAVVNQGFALDGLDDYLVTADSPDLRFTTALTIEAWLRVDQLPPSGYAAPIVQKDSQASGQRSYDLAITADGRLYSEVFGDGTDGSAAIRRSAAQLTIGTFAHVALVYDGAVGRHDLYINGELSDGTQTLNAGVVPASLYQSTQPVYLGAYLQGVHPFPSYTGMVADDIKLYNRALGGDEVRAEFDATGTLHDVSPFTVVWYNYGSSGTATTIVDSSGNGYNASATGATFTPDRPPDADQIAGVPLTAGSFHIDGNFGSGAVTSANDLVTNAGIAAYGGLTMETWFRRDSTNNNAGGLQKLFQIELENFFIPRDGDQIGWSDGITAPPLFATAAVGEWHHVAAVFVPVKDSFANGTVSGALRLYLDGEFVYGQPETLYAYRDNASGPLFVGRSNTQNETFAGELFATRVTLGALTPAEFLLPSETPPENHAPIPVAGGPYAMIDGGSVALNGAGSSDPDGNTLSYSWTINGHTGAASGATPTLSWATLQAAGITTAGVYDVSLTVDDGHGGVDTSATTLTVAFDARSLTDLSKALKAGRTIPIRLQLLDAAGNNISSPNITLTAIRLQRVNADGSRTPVSLEDSGNANPGNLFRYDASLQGYIFNLSTKNLVAGNYEFFWMAGNDTTEHKLTFALVQ